MIKAFIFDIDGTLVDTRQLHVNAWLSSFKEFGVDMAEEQVQSQLGRRAVEIARALLPEDKAGEAMGIVEKKWQLFNDFHSLVRPIPMTKELLYYLDGQGAKIALATSTIRRDAEFYVKLLSADRVIRALVTAEDVERSKPDPEIFLKAARRLNVSPEESAAVGDSPHDMAAASRAGMTAIGVLTGGFSKENLLAAGANKVLIDIRELYNHIGEILR